MTLFFSLDFRYYLRAKQWYWSKNLRMETFSW